MSCGRAQEFLAQAGIQVGTTVDAKKDRRGPDEALALARSVSEIIVAKGKRVVRVDMRKPPSDEELLSLLLGPSGNLRAPAIRKGKKLLIGFAADSYETVLR
jgi:arsenate reductase-like glutaredoxin family protein